MLFHLIPLVLYINTSKKSCLFICTTYYCVLSLLKSTFYTFLRVSAPVLFLSVGLSPVTSICGLAAAGLSNIHDQQWEVLYQQRVWTWPSGGLPSLPRATKAGWSATEHQQQQKGTSFCLHLMDAAHSLTCSPPQSYLFLYWVFFSFSCKSCAIKDSFLSFFQRY